MGEVKVGKHTIEFSKPEKIIFGKSGITKGDLIHYYSKIAPTMLPFLVNHPLTMHRFPEGIEHEGFYHKDAPSYFPPWIKRIAIPKEDGSDVHYVVCNNAETLVYLASQYCITPHLWLSRVDKVDFPDRMIFDLDPSPGAPFALVRQAAKTIKHILENEHGMKTFVMTTGSRGLHIIVPLNRKANFDTVRAFAHHIAEQVVEHDPKKFTTEIRKDKRGKRIFIDYLRNGFGATSVAPYAVRAREGAPIATPLSWDEVDSSTLKPDKYTIKNIFKRIGRKPDPWHDINDHAYGIPKK